MTVFCYSKALKFFQQVLKLLAEELILMRRIIKEPGMKNGPGSNTDV